MVGRCYSLLVSFQQLESDKIDKVSFRLSHVLRKKWNESIKELQQEKER